MNNLQALQSLEQSIQQQKSDNEHIMQETTKESLKELNKSLTSSFNQKLNSIEREITNTLYRYQRDPVTFKWSNIVMSFLLGILTMMILSIVVWFAQIAPYQVPESKRATDRSGASYIYAPKDQTIEQEGHIYIRIR